MKMKLEFFNCFEPFYKYVECQFNAKICVFQSDEGGEFTDRAFLQFLAMKGIHHQSTCPKTPEQNGKAERKHQNITELRLTMMFHAHLPPRFWIDCFSTAVFLINRLPSPHLNMESPFFKLYGRNPDYSSFQVLGSKCFPYLGEYKSHKLDPKSLPCVFIGYSMKHKGYKCLYPPTGRVYISRLVVFDEFIFPYSTPTSLYKSDPLEGELCIFSEWEIDLILLHLPLHHQMHHNSFSSEPPIVTISGLSLFEPCQASSSDPPVETTPIPLETDPTQHPTLTRSKVGVRKPNPSMLISM